MRFKYLFLNFELEEEDDEQSWVVWSIVYVCVLLFLKGAKRWVISFLKKWRGKSAYSLEYQGKLVPCKMMGFCVFDKRERVGQSFWVSPFWDSIIAIFYICLWLIIVVMSNARLKPKNLNYYLVIHPTIWLTILYPFIS